MRLIQKEETAHNEKRDLYNAFVAVVKSECVMEGTFFSFTSLPDMIVRKGYTRKQFEIITKLLVAVKDTYLKQRAKTEADSVDDESPVKP